MHQAPGVSIILPLVGHGGDVAAALNSCLSQTLPDVEIICVGDESTHDNAAIVRTHAVKDPRITMISLDAGVSMFQAQRAGVFAASAPFVLFLCGDDELAPHAAETARSSAIREKADVVEFGVAVVTPRKDSPRRFKAAPQPRHRLLIAPDIVPTLFPVGEVASGHLWRYCFSTSLLRDTYENVPEHLSLDRANDLPIALLALARAATYVSVLDRLYTHRARRCASQQTMGGIEHFAPVCYDLDQVDLDGPSVSGLSAVLTDPTGLLEYCDPAHIRIVAFQRPVKVAQQSLPGGNWSQAEAEITALRRERDRAYRKVQEIMEGPSFRAGRALTFLPRKARTLASWAKRTVRQTLNTVAGSTRSLSPATPPPPLSSETPAPARVATPDVSVIVPVFNSEPWLADCLSSVLAQTDVNLELICINDGSTDGSGAILEQFAERDSRVIVIEQANSGQSVGRNLGVERASGRYVIFLDSDDYWPYDSLAALVRHADQESLDVLLFDCVAFRDGDVEEKTWEWYAGYYQRTHLYQGVLSGMDLMSTMRRGRDYRPHVGLYMTRAAYARASGVRFIPGIVHQDNPYTFRLLMNAERAAHHRINVYARRIRPGSTITTLNAERSARGYFLAYLEMSREVCRHGSKIDPAIHDIVEFVLKGARKQFALISDSAAEEIKALDMSQDALAVFESLRGSAHSPSDATRR
ncbi:glycosyltransferase [Microbacterium sp. UFMG61]|uniref:glycosyltransferase n=1 Tax=Microbacterium sp. UFMG61 TaxID=2745935 RepID=UPI00188F0B9D|nr:glycosyltransferase [Microbacterium sp. UFMG61]